MEGPPIDILDSLLDPKWALCVTLGVDIDPLAHPPPDQDPSRIVTLTPSHPLGEPLSDTGRPTLTFGPTPWWSPVPISWTHGVPGGMDGLPVGLSSSGDTDEGLDVGWTGRAVGVVVDPCPHAHPYPPLPSSPSDRVLSRTGLIRIVGGEGESLLYEGDGP